MEYKEVRDSKERRVIIQCKDCGCNFPKKRKYDQCYKCYSKQVLSTLAKTDDWK